MLKSGTFDDPLIGLNWLPGIWSKTSYWKKLSGLLNLWVENFATSVGTFLIYSTTRHRTVY